MKIETLLELIEPDVRNINMRGRRFDRSTHADSVNGWTLSDKEKQKGFVGAGNYSAVKSDRDPHLVQKVSRNSDTAKLDGYWFFISQVIEHKLWENPYFPRVYQFKKYYSGEEAHYKVKLEKLIEMEALSKKELIAVISKIVSHDPEDSGIVQPYHTKQDMQHIISYLFERVWDGNIPKDIDSILVSAVNNLKKINEGKQFSYDLHAGNIMFRRGPHGLHPVIIDPFSRVTAS